MKEQVTVTGKTVDEAVAKAVEQLGAPSAEAINFVVDEEPRRGLFGIGSAPAKITATYIPAGEQIALSFITQLVKNMDLDAKIEMKDKDDGNKLITIEGEGASVLIGHHGETLDALQYLTNLATNRKEESDDKREYAKISVDVEGYRAKREESLRTLARRKAEQVLKFKKSVMLEPMNPYERRIIHSEIQNIPGVSTNSIGSENNRKVVIYLDAKK
ncbi:MAG: protein jag [Clostridia bacterium]|nr:protein jag [Clostridia bacterium]